MALGRPAVRSLLASSDVAARPLGRLAALPAASRDMVEMMACLGGRAERSPVPRDDFAAASR
jgi:hypothetical protein